MYQSTRWKHGIADRTNRSAYWYYPVKTDDGRTVPAEMCERCFARGILKPAEIIHHKTPLTPENVDDPEICYSFSNLMRVCRDCHAAIHSSRQSPRRVWFDGDGNIHWTEEEPW